MNICIQITMAEEAKPFIELLDFKNINPLNTPIPHNLYHTNIEEKIIHLIVNGRVSDHVSYLGTEMASLISEASLRLLKPDLLINAGTAGGKQSKGLKIGDVTICENSYYHDHRISIPGYHEYFKGNFSSTSKYFSSIKNLKSLIPSTISTGNSFEMNPSDEETISSLNSSVKEMELCAIAQVCSFYKTPWIGIKAITDIIDIDESPTSDQFFENLNLACKNLSISLRDIVTALKD